MAVKEATEDCFDTISAVALCEIKKGNGQLIIFFMDGVFAIFEFKFWKNTLNWNSSIDTKNHDTILSIM